nr:MAG TPA: hypothetical protein [Caudoviricetes sp.]
MKTTHRKKTRKWRKRYEAPQGGISGWRGD